MKNKSNVTENNNVTQHPEVEPKTIQFAPKHTPTTEEIKDKAVVLYHLQQKHNELQNKRRALDEFSITTDRNNATISVVDSKGTKFTSNNPKSINRLIEFWKEEFNTAIEEVEAEMVKAFEIQRQQVNTEEQKVPKVA